jgi:starch synthase
MPRLDVRVVIPFHPVIRDKGWNPDLLTKVEVSTNSGTQEAQIYSTRVNETTVYLIDGDPVRSITPVYSSNNSVDAEKYVFFCQAALQMVQKLAWIPDIIHANDWHTAPMLYSLALLKKSQPSGALRNTHTVFTIHNLPIMGAGAENWISFYNLPPAETDLLPAWGLHHPLPLGLLTADKIVTVSLTYAEEIMTPEFGCGLEKYLQLRQSDVSGILNGLDNELWNPATDKHLTQNFSSNTLATRVHNKVELLKEFDLDPDPTRPLLILISRMDQQKGVDLAVKAMYELNQLNWQMILLGTGDKVLEAACRKLEQDHPQRVRAAIRFDVGLSRRMYAGADMLVMPSRYEPCGLAQMISMRYGCVPIARATGGLKDSILQTRTMKRGTGYLFKPATPHALAHAIEKALDCYTDEDAWRSIQLNGMATNFSWEKPALEYAQLYQTLYLGREA